MVSYSMCLGKPSAGLLIAALPRPLSLQLLAQVLSLFLNQMWSIFSGFMVPYPGGLSEACWQRCMCDVAATPLRSARNANHLQRGTLKACACSQPVATDGHSCPLPAMPQPLALGGSG